MDQLLERDPGGAPAEILAEAIEQHMGGAGLDDSTISPFDELRNGDTLGFKNAQDTGLPEIR